MRLKKLSSHRQSGGSLIETMIALFVLAVGLLGFAALLTNSLTMNQRAFTLSQAMQLANNLTERMRMNRSEAGAYAIDLGESAPSAATDCSASVCSGAELAEWDQDQWFSLLEAQLPGGDAEVKVNDSADPIEVVIEIKYELRLGKVGSGDSDSLDQMENLISKLTTYSVSTEI